MSHPRNRFGGIVTRRRCAHGLAFVSLALSLYTAGTWALYKAEASHRTGGGLYFDLRDHGFANRGFSFTYGYPIGPPVVDENGNPIPERVAAAANPGPPSVSQAAFFTVERGKWEIYPDQLADPNFTLFPDRVQLHLRPHAYVKIYWPRWFMGVLGLIFAIGPILWLRHTAIRRQREFRLAHNLCITCAYDLRESPERCPECGTPNHGVPALIPK